MRKDENSVKFLIATHNPHKLRELERILQPLGIDAVTDRQIGLELPEVEETGTTFAENAYLKAASACAFAGIPAVADDSGISVDALGGAPGVYSARYGGPGLTDEDRVVKLLEDMKDVPPEKRQAHFTSAVCCVFPDGTVLRAEGICEGFITAAPVGENGFGYDPVFLYGDRTTAQMSSEEKDAISHRGKALAEFAGILTAYLKEKES